MPEPGDAASLDDNDAVGDLFIRGQNSAGMYCYRLHGLPAIGIRHLSMLVESGRKTTQELASVAYSVTIVCRLFSGGNWMANEKRFVAQKRQRRRRKAAKAKVKLYEQGKIPHDKLPALARKFLSRKMRALSKAE